MAKEVKRVESVESVQEDEFGRPIQVKLDGEVVDVVSGLEEVNVASGEETAAEPVIEKEVIKEPVISDFLSVEAVPSLQASPLSVYNKNPKYEFYWARKDQMAGGRFGIWVAVDRNHPDFAGLRVEIDHSPEESFIQYGDLILCCTRQETAQAKSKALRDMTNSRSAQFEGKVKETVDRMYREGPRGMSKITEDLVDAPTI